MQVGKSCTPSSPSPPPQSAATLILNLPFSSGVGGIGGLWEVDWVARNITQAPLKVSPLPKACGGMMHGCKASGFQEGRVAPVGQLRHPPPVSHDLCYQQCMMAAVYQVEN